MESKSNSNIFFYLILFVLFILLAFCMIGEKKNTPQEITIVNSNIVVKVQKKTNSKKSHKKEEHNATTK